MDFEKMFKKESLMPIHKKQTPAKPRDNSMPRATANFGAGPPMMSMGN